MFDELRQQRSAKRVKSGDGRLLKRFRWWHLLRRALFYLPFSRADGSQIVYAVDVPLWGDPTSGEVKANLYLDGRHHAESKVPTAFPVEGGAIEVAVSTFGIKRCHFVTADGAEHQLTPDARSAEGRRARLERDHPVLSRRIGVFSVIMLVIGVGLNLLQLAEPITQIPPIAETVGRFESPVHLPLWLNITLGLGAALASTERTLRLRYHWLLDSAGN